MSKQIIPKLKDFKPVFSMDNTIAIIPEDQRNSNWQDENR